MSDEKELRENVAFFRASMEMMNSTVQSIKTDIEKLREQDEKAHKGIIESFKEGFQRIEGTLKEQQKDINDQMKAGAEQALQIKHLEKEMDENAETDKEQGKELSCKVDRLTGALDKRVTKLEDNILRAWGPVGAILTAIATVIILLIKKG